jgi:epoxyqueuosine reductase
MLSGLNQDMQVDMWYLTEEGRKKKRGAPNEAFPAAKSVLMAAFSYKPKNDKHKTNAKFARYGWGKDYHKFVKHKLEDLMKWAQEQSATPIQYRVYVDTGPILEKSLAERSGAGWIAKNTCLIHPKFGSYLLLGEILMDLELAPDKPATQLCGSCTKCLEACPTQAFIAPFQMDATKCISYQTIESKSLEMPEAIFKKFKWLGCRAATFARKFARGIKKLLQQIWKNYFPAHTHLLRSKES